MWNPESLTLESGIQLNESGIPLTITIQNPSTTDKESGIRNPAPRLRIPRLSCQIPLHVTRDRIYTGAESLLAPILKAYV